MFSKTQEASLNIDIILQKIEQQLINVDQLLRENIPASQRLYQVRDAVEQISSLRKEVFHTTLSLEGAAREEVPKAVEFSLKMIQQSLSALSSQDSDSCSECGETLKFEAEMNYRLCRSCLRHLEGVYLCYQCGREIFEDVERDERRCIECLEEYQKSWRW